MRKRYHEPRNYSIVMLYQIRTMHCIRSWEGRKSSHTLSPWEASLIQQLHLASFIEWAPYLCAATSFRGKDELLFLCYAAMPMSCKRYVLMTIRVDFWCFTHSVLPWKQRRHLIIRYLILFILKGTNKMLFMYVMWYSCLHKTFLLVLKKKDIIFFLLNRRGFFLRLRTGSRYKAPTRVFCDSKCRI